ncbi:MAG: helix-turn-helix transcriptional regulator [Clostridia bacterium]
MNEGRLWRLLKILRLASSNTKLNAAAMAHELSVSRRTFHRDREVLERAGIPLVFDGTGYALAGRPFLPSVQLRWDEGLALLITLRAAMDSGGNPFSESIQNAIEKIESGIPPSVRQEISDAVGEIDVEQRPMVDMSQHGDTFDMLWRACRDHKVVRIKYWGRGDDTPVERPIEPLAVFQRWRAWYVVAYCRLRDELRTFRVDRVTDSQLTEESFVRPRGFNLEEFLAAAWLVERGEAVEVRIYFRGLAARLVKELEWHPSQRIVREDSEGVVAEFHCGGLGEMAEWVVGFGGEAEVIAPDSMRQMVVDLARRVLDAHR